MILKATLKTFVSRLIALTVVVGEKFNRSSVLDSLSNGEMIKRNDFFIPVMDESEWFSKHGPLKIRFDKWHQKNARAFKWQKSPMNKENRWSTLFPGPRFQIVSNFVPRVSPPSSPLSGGKALGKRLNCHRKRIFRSTDEWRPLEKYINPNKIQN